MNKCSECSKETNIVDLKGRCNMCIFNSYATKTINTQTKETTMENNNEQKPTTLYTQEHVDQLHATITELQLAQAETAKQSQFRAEDSARWRERYENERHNRLKILQLAHELFEEMLENDDDTLDAYESSYNAFVNYGMEGFTKEVNYTLSFVVTVSGTASVPYGSDFSEYDAQYLDINVDEENFIGQLVDECTEISMDVEVEERDRSRSWEVTN